jgi:ribosomal protein S18 acetylase RimI-like enzyme
VQSAFKKSQLEVLQPTIRRVLLADAQILSDLSLKVFYDTFIHSCTEEDMQAFLLRTFNVDQLRSELSDPNDLFFFVEVNQQAVGFLRLKEDYSSLPVMKEWKAIEVKRLYVLKEFHGKGLADLLMNFAIQFAKENSYQAMWLGVWEHNYRAQAFYRKFDFNFSGHEHDFPIGKTPQMDQWFWKFFEK